MAEACPAPAPTPLGAFLGLLPRSPAAAQPLYRPRPRPPLLSTAPCPHPPTPSIGAPYSAALPPPHTALMDAMFYAMSEGQNNAESDGVAAGDR